MLTHPTNPVNLDGKVRINMKNRTTQNRELTSVTRDENEALDENLAVFNRIFHAGKRSDGNAEALRLIAETMYHVIYPRTVRKPRHFAGRQRRVLSSIKLGG